MRHEDFSERSAGRLIEIMGGTARAFLPNPIPRACALSPETGRLIGAAGRAIGRLEAGVSALPNADLFLHQFQLQEAVGSSAIEGTHTTLVEAYADAAAGVQQYANKDRRAVANYTTALKHGIAEIDAGRGISPHLLRSLQAQLLQGEPEHDAHAGRFRTTQAALGTEAARLDISLARFVPPPGELVEECMADVSAYLSEHGALAKDDALVRVALTHYQFEAIHPFGDGNGRVGRMLIALQMMQEGVTKKPRVYLSAQIDRRKDEYVSLLYRVSTESAYDAWLQFFFKIVLAAADTTLAKLERFQEVANDIRARLVGYHSQLPGRLLPELMRLPVLTVPDAMRVLDCNKATARGTILAMVDRGILTADEEPFRYEGQIGRPPTLYRCQSIIDVMLRREP